jgi:hexulose-6-phosphate isomerase
MVLPPTHSLHRRDFVKDSVKAVAAAAAASTFVASAAADTEQEKHPAENQGRIFKSVKWGMIGEGKSILEKFELQKELGYDGIEMNSPQSEDANEVVEASRRTGMPVHGVVDSVHWNQRLSSPDESIRNKGREALAQAIRDADDLGGNAVLLVPGQVTGDEENHEHVWKRSQAEVRKVLPVASKHGVRILIENVWNGFCETPEQLRDYIDEFESPWVGSYFDIGNCRKFAPSEQWIRVLQHRIVKLDVKDWGVKNGFCKIGDGDVNWPEVRKALAEIGFTGWCTAEVSGGKRDRLADIASRMNRVLALG